MLSVDEQVNLRDALPQPLPLRRSLICSHSSEVAVIYASLSDTELSPALAALE